MNRIGGPPSLKTLLTWGFGSGVGALAAWRTGLVTAVPMAIGLTVLAVADHESRRLPREVFRWTTYGALLCAIVDVVRAGTGMPAVIALTLAEIVGFFALALWAITGGIAFGDVKLITLAAVIPAWRSPQRIQVFVVAAVIVAFFIVVVRESRKGYLDTGDTIAFAPPILVGWILAVAA